MVGTLSLPFLKGLQPLCALLGLFMCGELRDQFLDCLTVHNRQVEVWNLRIQASRQAPGWPYQTAGGGLVLDRASPDASS
jgi:hypothetical protein